MKQLKIIVAMILLGVLLMACASDDESSNKVFTAEESIEKFFEAVNSNNYDFVMNHAYEGQSDSLRAGMEELKQQLDVMQVEMQVENIVGEVEVDDYKLFIILSKLVDKDDNTLNYFTFQIPFMDVNGQNQFVWDFNLLPETIRQQESVLLSQMQQLQQDQEVLELLNWADEQNRIHQEAFNMHQRAHQEAINQHQQMMQQQMMQQQQLDQMMTPPPAGF